jgi:predicted GNAT family N-acyltransferase
MPSSISIVTAAWPADLEHIQQVRRAVFIVEQHVPEHEEWDEVADQACRHVLAFADGKAIGTARLSGGGKIGRVAVLKAWRGQGIGSRLMEHILDLARSEGMRRLYLDSQQSATDFYRPYGFQPIGEPFMEANIPHQRMELAW